MQDKTNKHGNNINLLGEDDYAISMNKIVRPLYT